MRRHCIVAAVATLAIAQLALVDGALAESLTFKATLVGTDEVPPTDSPAKGNAMVSYDTDSKRLVWSVTYSGLTGPATAAHFHGPAEPGAAAGVVVPVPTEAIPMEGSATLTDAQAKDLIAGRWYVNVHTAKFKDGEIRGQVLKEK